jgi:hypothetical protein
MVKPTHNILIEDKKPGHSGLPGMRESRAAGPHDQVSPIHDNCEAHGRGIETMESDGALQEI